jgi:transcriptional regulator with XRE-family HTH domain
LDIICGMVAADLIARARAQAGISQRALAERAGTSQATISAYESGRKDPSVETLGRLLAAMGARLTVEPADQVAVAPSATELRRRGRVLSDVLALAEALPSRHEPRLRYPRLDRAA